MGISPYSLNRTNIARLPYVKYLPQCDISVYEMKCAARRAFLNLKRNDNRQNVAACFSARKRYFASCALFFHIFSRKREKIWSPKAQLQRRCKNSTAVQSQKCRALARSGGQHPQGVCRIRSAPSAQRADRVVRPYARSETPRISYVKYSTGANLATCTVFRAMRKPDSTVARRAFGLQTGKRQHAQRSKMPFRA